jgi:hypothetical protein
MRFPPPPPMKRLTPRTEGIQLTDKDRRILIGLVCERINKCRDLAESWFIKPITIYDLAETIKTLNEIERKLE